jgi:hypothetical protein
MLELRSCRRALQALGSPWLLRELGAASCSPPRCGPISTAQKYRQEAYNVGALMDFQLQVMHRWPMMLPISAARGFCRWRLRHHQFMLAAGAGWTARGPSP